MTYGVDYSDTFSPVAKMTFVRFFISLVATHNWDLHQLDIKNAFVHDCQRWRLQLSKMEASIIKDGGFKYGGLKLSIIWPPTLHFFFLVR